MWTAGSPALGVCESGVCSQVCVPLQLIVACGDIFWEAPKSLKHLEMAWTVCSSSVMPLLMLHGLSRHGESLTFSLGKVLVWVLVAVGGGMRMPLHGGV